MRRAAQTPPSRSRSRRKTPDASLVVPTVEPRNVDSIEALLSLTLGLLMVFAALVPRTLKQAFLLALGGGLAYRGLTGNCGFYKATGIDTAKGSLVKQVGDKLKAPAKA